MLTGAQVLNDCDACEAKLRSYRLHQLAIINESIFQHLEVTYPDASKLLAYSTVSMEDNSSMEVVQLQRYASNLQRYYQLLENMEQKEAIAHLANLFESGSYQEAILFISTFCPEIYQKLTDFIASL